jgi:hypothetical protein
MSVVRIVIPRDLVIKEKETENSVTLVLTVEEIGLSILSLGI